MRSREVGWLYKRYSGMSERYRATDFESSSYSELDELVTRVFCDTAPKEKVDAVYLYGQTPDNETSVLKAGVFLYGLGPAKMIAISASGAVAGYPGFDGWKRKLIGMGVPDGDILGVPLSDDFPPSTHAEARGVVKCAEERGWKSIYVVAPPLHLLRAFVTTVSEALKQRSPLLVYSFPGIAQSWEEHVIHSQGIQEGTRAELLSEELKKIEDYYKKGDLASAEEVLQYLDRRDE